MKIYQRLAWVPFLAVCLVISTSCASVHPTVNTWRNPDYSPTKTNTVALKTHEGAEPDDLATEQMITTGLRNEGFALAPENRADYLLTYQVTDNLEQHEETFGSPVMATPPRNNDQIMNGTGDMSSGGTTSYTTQSREVRLFLLTNPKTNPKGLQFVWQGTISTTKETTPEDESVMLKTLLQYFGQDKNGTVDLIHK